MERTSRELRKPVQKEHSEKRFRKGSFPCSPCAQAQLMQYSVSKSTCASLSGVCSRCATAFCSYSSGSHVFMDVRSAVCRIKFHFLASAPTTGLALKDITSVSRHHSHIRHAAHLLRFVSKICQGIIHKCARPV